MRRLEQSEVLPLNGGGLGARAQLVKQHADAMGVAQWREEQVGKDRKTTRPHRCDSKQYVANAEVDLRSATAAQKSSISKSLLFAPARHAQCPVCSSFVSYLTSHIPHKPARQTKTEHAHERPYVAQPSSTAGTQASLKLDAPTSDMPSPRSARVKNTHIDTTLSSLSLALSPSLSPRA